MNKNTVRYHKHAHMYLYKQLYSILSQFWTNAEDFFFYLFCILEELCQNCKQWLSWTCRGVLDPDHPNPCPTPVLSGFCSLYSSSYSISIMILLTSHNSSLFKRGFCVRRGIMPLCDSWWNEWVIHSRADSAFPNRDWMSLPQLEQNWNRIFYSQLNENHLSEELPFGSCVNNALSLCVAWHWGPAAKSGYCNMHTVEWNISSPELYKYLKSVYEHTMIIQCLW